MQWGGLLLSQEEKGNFFSCCSLANECIAVDIYFSRVSYGLNPKRESQERFLFGLSVRETFQIYRWLIWVVGSALKESEF